MLLQHDLYVAEDVDLLHRPPQLGGLSVSLLVETIYCQVPPGIDQYNSIAAQYITALLGGSRSMRNYFSTNFLWTALHTSRLVGELETSEGSRPRFDMAHRSYAASSVIASATFLDAAVSELFQDAQDGHGLTDYGYLAPLGADAVAAMSKVWRATNGGRHLNPVEKWQWLLECCGHYRLDRGAAPAQDAALLVRLRNTLIHFQPENIAADEEHELERRLRVKVHRQPVDGGFRQPLVAEPWPRAGVQ